MGKPIPSYRKEAAYQLVKHIGVEPADDRVSLINSVSEHLERDRPYEAQATAMKYLDLTGTYMLIAALLTSDPEMENAEIENRLMQEQEQEQQRETVIVTREMAIDAGDRSMEGASIQW